MLSIFQQPYPRQDSLRKQVLIALFFGLFVFLFLWLFKPFGLSSLQLPNHLFIFIGYGILTAAIMIIHALVLPKFFRKWFAEAHWTVLKEILETIFVILLIATSNFFYSYWLGMFSLSVRSFESLVFFTVVLAILPVTILVMFQEIRMLRKNIEEVKNISNDLFSGRAINKIPADSPVQLIAENEKDMFTALSQHLFYILSADNYIEIVSATDQKDIKKTLLRSTLKRAQNQLSRHPGFYRCHRTYIVNLNKVKSIVGNAQGYKLVLEHLEEQIPVSRNLNKEIISVLKGLKSSL